VKKTTLDIEVFEREPPDFSPQAHIAACYLEFEGKILLLQQAPNKLEPGRWGIPAGKIEKNETPKDAALRELFEETGISVHQSSNVHYLKPLYMRKPTIDYVFHLFKIHLDHVPDVRISVEHQNYKWASPQDLKTMSLMVGAKEALQSLKEAAS
jgi:8-oxo-dGTP diphosphatase